MNLYKSKLEKANGAYLNAQGAIFEYETVVIPYFQLRSYTPDFWLKNNILIETKGWWKSSDRTKHHLVREQHPELDIRFVFQNANNKLSKKSSTTYADYCNRQGWKWAEGLIPLKWIYEDVKPLPLEQ